MADRGGSGLHITLLDSFTVGQDGRPPLPLFDRKQERLLAYLALAPARPHLRENISQLFWPDKARKLRRNRLAEVLVLLRRLLEEAGLPGDLVDATRHTLQLADHVSTDIADFERLVEEARQSGGSEEAGALSRRLREFYGAGLLPFLNEDWIQPERMRLSSLYLEAMQALGASPDLAHAMANGPAAFDPMAGDTRSDMGRLNGTAASHIEPLDGETTRLLAMAEAAALHCFSPERDAYFAGLDAERESLNFALDRAIDLRQVDLANRFAGALWPYWLARGELESGRERLERVLMLQSGTEPQAYCEVVHGSGAMALSAGDVTLARVRMRLAHDLWKKLGHERFQARSAYGLGTTEMLSGKHELARKYFDASLGTCRPLQWSELLVQVLNHAARNEHESGNDARAYALLSERLAVVRSMNDDSAVAWALHDLAKVAVQLERFEEAERMGRKSLSSFESLADRRGRAAALLLLGSVSLENGDRVSALRQLTEAERIYREEEDMLGVAEAMFGQASATDSPLDPVRCQVLLDQSRNLFRAMRDYEGVVNSVSHLERVLAER
jgi:tetratricopeptide (TPR) repeat protein